jgi:predicted dehydrogenase
MNNPNLWLIGAGKIALAYAKVLNHHSVAFNVFGRGKVSASTFSKITSKEVIFKDLLEYSKNNHIPSHAIVCVNIINLFEITLTLINIGVKFILVEKPGSLLKEELIQLDKSSSALGIRILLAYNRRFYDNVNFIRKSVISDGGINSINFEFTEWTRKLNHLINHKDVLSEWLVCNSSHVIDLAFYIAGIPEEMSSFIQGKGTFSWYDKASTFVGAGIIEGGILFSYNSCWKGPGNWSIEVTTNERRYKISPLETSFIRNHGELNYSEKVLSKSSSFKKSHFFISLFIFLPRTFLYSFALIP